MSKAKGKGGTGRGTGKKGWNRWQASANKKRVQNLIEVKVQKKRLLKMTPRAIIKYLIRKLNKYNYLRTQCV